MMNDPTEYGNDGHFQYCRECGCDAYLEGESFDSCPFKNCDQQNEWEAGWLAEQERAKQ